MMDEFKTSANHEFEILVAERLMLLSLKYC